MQIPRAYTSAFSSSSNSVISLVFRAILEKVSGAAYLKKRFQQSLLSLSFLWFKEKPEGDTKWIQENSSFDTVRVTNPANSKICQANKKGSSTSSFARVEEEVWSFDVSVDDPKRMTGLINRIFGFSFVPFVFAQNKNKKKKIDTRNRLDHVS